MVEPAQTPSLSPIITLPTHETKQQETPTIGEIQAHGLSINKEGLRFEELKWALEINDNVQKMLSHYKTHRNQIKAQQEENKNWLSTKADFEEKLKELDCQMDELQLSYLNIAREHDSWKSKALEWK